MNKVQELKMQGFTTQEAVEIAKEQENKMYFEVAYLKQTLVEERYDEENNMQDDIIKRQILTTVISEDKMFECLCSMEENAADMGDGRSFIEVLYVCDTKTREPFPKESEYYKTLEEEY